MPTCTQFLVKTIGVILNIFYLHSEQKKNISDIQDLRDKIIEVLEQEPYMGERIRVR